MTARILVPPKFVGETRTEYVDFAPFLVGGQTLVSGTAVCSVYSGTDSTPSAVISSVSVSGFQALVKLTGGVEGVIYQILVSVVTANPVNTLQVSFYLSIVPALP